MQKFLDSLGENILLKYINYESRSGDWFLQNIMFAFNIIFICFKLFWNLNSLQKAS